MIEYTFDEEKHVHMFDGEKIMGCTTVLDIIAKPALIQWAADLAAVAGLEKRPEFAELKKDYEDTHAIEDYEEKKKAKVKLDKKYPEYKECRLTHRAKKEKAADWGTLVHKAIETWIGTKAIPTAVIVKGANYILLEEHLVAIRNFVEWATVNNVEFLLSEKNIYSKEWKVGGIVDFVCRIDGRLMIGDLKTSKDIYESYFIQASAYGKMMMEMGMYERFDGVVIVNCKKNGKIVVEERKDVAGNIRCFEAALLLSNRLS